MPRPPPARPNKLLLTATEVADLLNMSASAFRSRRKALDAVGFPRPVPAMGDRYDLVAIKDWLARQRVPISSGQPRPLGPNGMPAPDDDEGWDRELDRRLSGDPLPAVRAARRFADPVRETARLLRLRETNPNEFNTKAPKRRP